MLEMGMAYLPTNSNWSHYLEQAEDATAELNSETLRILAQHAREACNLMQGELYRKDIWMWNQDWTTKNIKVGH